MDAWPVQAECCCVDDMGPLFLQTSIADERVAHHGQPPWETIALDSVVRLPGVVRHSYAETVRFGDYLRRGGESVRYYHLLAYSRGHALSIPASGSSRLLSGLYEGRQITLARVQQPIQTVIAAEANPAKPLALAAHSMIRVQCGMDIDLIARFNCLEAFPNHYTLSASLRIPDLILESAQDASAFDEILAQHSVASGPLFRSIACATIDATLVVDVARGSDSASRANLQFTVDREMSLPTPEIFAIP